MVFLAFNAYFVLNGKYFSFSLYFMHFIFTLYGLIVFMISIASVYNLYDFKYWVDDKIKKIIIIISKFLFKILLIIVLIYNLGLIDYLFISISILHVLGLAYYYSANKKRKLSED